MRGDWIEKGGKKFGGELQMEKMFRVHDDKKGKCTSCKGSRSTCFSPINYICLQKCIVMSLNMCNTIKPCDAEVSG